jgi:hypothetical protein
MANVYFVSFGGPSAKYHAALRRVCSEAARFNLFTTIFGYTDIYLKNDSEFWNKHSRFITNNPRGYGYWLWKSHLCKRTLDKLNDGDVMIYADAGCAMNINGKTRLLEYIGICKNHESGIVSFQMPHVEKCWTKGDISKHLSASPDDLSSGQLVGGIFLIRKCKHVVELVNKWYETCSLYELIDDTPSYIPNAVEFIENRHDQSIWSILRKQHGSFVLPDETYFANWSSDGAKYPFWATRMI